MILWFDKLKYSINLCYFWPMFFAEIVNDAYDPREYPALALLADQWIRTRPFEGLKVLVATPIFRNTLLQYRAVIAGGAELFVGYAAGNSANSGATMPFDPKIINVLREEGIPVITDEDVKNGSVADDFDLILDCAGQFSFCHPKKGFVELTRSGVQFYEKSEFPVYVADSGIVKRIETTLGTGDGYFRALEQLGHKNFEGKKLVVFGSGKVGCGIALQGVRRGLQVTTVTVTSNRNSSTDFSRVLENNDVTILDHMDEKEVIDAVNGCDFLVTATGVKSVLSLPVITALNQNRKIVAANMGVEDEFGNMVPRFRVLNRKVPLNFILEEPTHLKYIDASLALHAALAERLLQDLKRGDVFSGPRDPAGDIEQVLLVTTIQHGEIGDEICDMLR